MIIRKNAKLFSALLSLVMLCTLIAGCTTSVDPPTRTYSPTEGYEDIIVGDCQIYETHKVLDDYETIQFGIPSDIKEEDYYELMGLYIGDDYSYYYFLDRDKLEEGIGQFDILHHSVYSLAHPDKSVVIDEWTKRAAVNIVTKDVADGKIEVSMKELINDTLEDLGIDSESYGGAVFRYVMSQDVKGEILTAALDGDMNTLKNKYASFVTDGIVSLCGLNGAGNVVDIVTAYSDSENWAEGGVNLCKEIERKVFPAIDATEKFAKLVDKTFDIWASDAMDETYRYVFKKYADGNGNISDDDWATVYSTIHGAWARYSSKGIDEKALRESFETRARNEVKIAEKEKELKKLVKVWDDSGLLNPYAFDYPKNWSTADRLKSLYNTRNNLKAMFTKDGKLQMGKLQGKMTENDFLNELTYQWTINGIKNRSKFYEWLEEEGIVDKKSGKATDKSKNIDEDNKLTKSAWVLVNTEIEKSDNTDTGVYRDTYEASETSHTQTCEYIGDMNHYEKGVFTASFDAPPKTIYPDEEFALHITLTKSGTTEHYFQASCWYKIESPDIHYGATSGGPKFETKDGKRSFGVCTANANAENWDEVVYGSLGQGWKEGDKKGIFFCGCGADTRWIYEWKEVK